eukprot:1171783-Pyramimonas_sp.AAC.1
METGWNPQQAIAWDSLASHPAAGDMWKFDETMYRGLTAPDSHHGFLADFKQMLRHALWQRASRHFCGAGLEQLLPGLAAAVGGYT